MRTDQNAQANFSAFRTLGMFELPVQHFDGNRGARNSKRIGTGRTRGLGMGQKRLGQITELIGHGISLWSIHYR